MSSRIFCLSLLVIVFVSLSCASDTVSHVNISPTPAESPRPDNAGRTTEFDGERALNHVKVMVEFGPRPGGSENLQKTREFIIRELKSYGLKTVVDEFRPSTPKGKIKMANIIAELPGERPEAIIIASHYDTKLFKEFTFVGANDSGSSTGALLEIARVMAAEKAAGKISRKFSYQFVFLDGEEAFCREWSECLNGNDNTYGSRHFAERLQQERRTDQVKALILLDMIGDKNLSIPREENSSAWLVEAIWSTARELGYADQFTNDTHMITDDHIPFLKAGISSVDLIDFDYGDDNTDYWHTEHDTLDKLSAESLKIVGDVVILSLSKIENLIR